MKGRDIIIVGQQAWDVEIGSNCRNIALEFSKHNRVLYVNSALDRITKIRYTKDPKVKKRLDVIHGKQSGLEQVSENLWVYYPDRIIESINWLRVHWLFRVLNRRNNVRFASSIQRAISQLELKDFILFNDSDMFRSFYLKDLLNPSITLYYSRDNMMATDYYKRHGKHLEPEIMRKSDLCVANSVYLQQYCKNFNERSYYVGQGCDLELFEKPAPSSVPAGLQNVPGPIIGYVGALTAARLDIALLEYLANNHPDSSFVLVGPEDREFQKSKLHYLRNVFFLGAKPVKDLPAYIQAFNICINPQLLNDLTIGNYPRKIDEYLAMGKPVVATRTDTMEAFSNYTYLAANKEEFSDKIKIALLDNNFETQLKRKAFAFSHTWVNSVNLISEGIQEVESYNFSEV